MSMGDKVLSRGLVASVAVDHALFPYDFLYDYAVPDDLIDLISAGKRVVVPFGKGNKRQIAMVFSLEEKEFDRQKTKPISSVLQDGIVLSDEMLYLAAWLKENTFCTYFDAIRTILPSGLTFSITAKYELNSGFKDEAFLSEKEQALYNRCKSTKSNRELDFILDGCGEENEKIKKSLIAKGCINKIETVKRRVGDETEKMVRLADDYEKNDRMANLSAKQKLVVEALYEAETASIKELCYLCNVTPIVIKNLVKYCVLEEFSVELSRSLTVSAEANRDVDDIVFSETQQEVFDGLLALMNDEKPRCALLHGITGSGKTSVFIKLINEALKQGKTALMLVPEISLTPQMVENFQQLFGSDVAIIHSNLSMGQRADEYKRINSGEARIVIGTRSAVFAPIDNIGIIVIDEEGEHTYKSEKSPRYHARNVAKQRCFRHNALLLLASATPSLDSYYNAEIGRYTLFSMNERYKSAVLPEVYLVDMKVEAENGNRSNFSEVLIHELRQNLERGEQSLLLLNRRGYHTYANCIACGAVIECPNCNVPLTYHKINDNVICHICGYSAHMPDSCPTCGSRYIHQSGTGTQRVEDEIQNYFPNARILRMDADTTMSKNAFSTKFAQFGQGEYDIMVGTQMIAKGLDFENVTLVGVLSIDKALYAGDYMSYERTFSLVTQVVGRSGRGSKKGRAYMQTFTPDHYVLQLAASQNYLEFYRQEIEIRKALLYPPFCDICLVGFSSLIDSACIGGAKRFVELFTERMNREQNLMPIRILGPTKIGSGKMAGRFRNKLVMKCKFNKQFRTVMNDVLLAAYKDKAFANVNFYVDINGEIM